MSIRRVDMQVVVQKTQESHQGKQTVVNKMDNELVQAQGRTREENIKRHQSVNELERSELRRVKNDNEDDEDRQKKRYKASKKQKEKEEEEEKLNRRISKSGTHFDMKV